MRYVTLAFMIGSLVGGAVMPQIALAASGVVGPFWAQPFPYNYAGAIPYDACYERRHVLTQYGWRWHRVWVCGHVVTSRY